MRCIGLTLARGSPPFTLQRLTEVILEPHKFYKSLNKLINALEKVGRRPWHWMRLTGSNIFTTVCSFWL